MRYERALHALVRDRIGRQRVSADFYCTDEYLLGNISDKDFFTLEHSNKAVDFIKESLVVDETCKSCEYYMLCKGGCKRERRDVEKCKAYKTFFRFALPYLKNMS